jgi:Sortase domain
VSQAPTGRRGRRRTVFAALVILAVTGAAGTLAVRHTLADVPAASWVEGSFFDLPHAAPPTDATGARGAPTRLRIAKLGIDSPLESLHLDRQGELEAPKDYARAGWYVDGTSPGDPGPAVIAGHVDNRQGPAVFFKLHELRAGDLVEIRRGDQWLTFRVTGTAWYAKSRFPSAQVYGPTPDAQLRLITCGGEFNPARGSYVDNLVVYAATTAGF